MLSATSQAPAVLAETVEARNRGTGTLSIRGTYTGTDDAFYRVVVTDASSNLYMWSDDGGSTYTGPLVASAFVWVALSNGVEIMFTPGAMDPQLVNGDEWRFKAIRPYGLKNLLNHNRDSEFRTAAITTGNGASVLIDFGGAVAPKALIIGDQNAPSGTNVAIAASANSNMTPLSVNEAVTWTAGHILHVLANTSAYRYWSVTMNSLPSDVAYLRMSELYLGDMTTLGLAWNIGYEDDTYNTGESPESVLMRGVGAYGFVGRRLRLDFQHRRVGAANDAGKLDAVWRACHDSTRLRQTPCWLSFTDVSGLEMLELAHFVGGRRWQHQFLDRMDVPVELVSVVRTAA
jgi:hypothetical protein